MGGLAQPGPAGARSRADPPGAAALTGKAGPMHLSKIVCALSLILTSMATPAVAQTSPQTHAPRDPNERVCENVTGIGSRIGAKKICATRAEWAERRRHDREALEEIQRLQGRPCVDARQGTGAAPAC